MFVHCIHGHRIEVADDHGLAILCDAAGREIQRFAMAPHELADVRNNSRRPLLLAILAAKELAKAAAEEKRRDATAAVAANDEGEK